uniref:Uncharacterized protein n=1 Tax=Calidris pygmaea TaxID=425635 RepID=A0A8C3PLQ6_9CHAR
MTYRCWRKPFSLLLLENLKVIGSRLHKKIHQAAKEGKSTNYFECLMQKLSIRQKLLCKCLWILTMFMQMLCRNKENSSPLESDQTQGKNKLKKRKIAETSNVITETLPSAESEPVEIEVEIAEGTIEVEDDSIETLEVASAEQSIKYIQTTDTSDESALALLADITSKYRQGEKKCQIQEEGDSATDPSCKQVEGIEIVEFQLVHRIIEWFGLEGTLKIIEFQTPCHGQGHLPLDQVAQSPIQPGLEHLQGWGSHNFSGQPVPVSHHPHSKEFLPNI